MTTLADLGAYLGGKHKELVTAIAAKATPSDIVTAITALKGGVPTAGDTLNKLYSLVVNAVQQYSAADIAARNALNVPAGAHVFVSDAGDGKWALYRATTSGVGATYVLLSDPDLLNATLTAAQIKTAYESNADTNAFTDALETKLTDLPTAASLTASLAAKVDSAALGNSTEFQNAFAAAVV